MRTPSATASVGVAALLGGLVPAVAQPSPGRATPAPAPLVLSLDKYEFAPGEPIDLSVTLTNTFGAGFAAFVTTPEYDYAYRVRLLDRNGTPTPAGWTAYGAQLLDPKNISERVVYRYFTGGMGSGQVRRETVMLSRLFDMSRNGTYVIAAVGGGTLNGKSVTFSSLPVTITVD